MLGALLGTLEVVATDDVAPLAALQAERVHSAVRLCHGLQHQLEALLTLAAEDLEQRLRRTHSTMHALVEHAVRSAVRGFQADGVQLRLPEDDAWIQERVFIDVSRVDRMLKALAETLAASVGRGGAVEVSVQRGGAHVQLTLMGHVGTPHPGRLGAPPTLASSQLLARGAARLMSLLGGACSVDVQQLHVQLRLPASEAS
jgi:hypothetical protein